ncbi:unnamed protein product [Meloidogyne enterolobii]|uniref:Uncharacterized protein n=1 Tax=Meloidogyne enterolobii TaxID=390850 RepID=A0ACB0YLW0_MELEN
MNTFDIFNNLIFPQGSFINNVEHNFLKFKRVGICHTTSQICFYEYSYSSFFDPFSVIQVLP